MDRNSTVWNCCGITTIPNDRVAVQERFGKYQRTLRSGLHCVWWCVGESIAGSLSLRVNQLDVVCETKTLDNVFVHVVIAVQFIVDPTEVENAFYKLSNVKAQLTAYVYDSVRSQVPRMKLDDVFESKDEIAKVVQDNLSLHMPDFGYSVLKALVSDINPNEKVKTAMNAINAAQRHRAAAHEQAQAQKIIVVTAAEAEAESKYLNGVGIARQRQAIVAGLKESVVNFTDDVSEVSPKDVLQLMLMTQYFDTLREIGQSSSVIFVPHSPGSVEDIGSQVRQAMMEANVADVKAGSPQSQTMRRVTSGKHNPAAGGVAA